MEHNVAIKNKTEDHQSEGNSPRTESKTGPKALSDTRIMWRDHISMWLIVSHRAHAKFTLGPTINCASAVGPAFICAPACICHHVYDHQIFHWTRPYWE